MWTQRDQVQAYQFLRRRLVSALVSADANNPVSPVKPPVLGTLIGVAVLLLVAAVVGVVGLLRPGSGTDWKQAGQVVVEKETGARFVLGQGGVLHPVLNFASARLFVGGEGAKVVTIPAKSLDAAPRGSTVGIPGAPDSLPDKGKLVSGPWTGCSRTSADRPAADQPKSTVVLGRAVDGRRLAVGEGVLVGSRTGERFLVTDGRRHRLADDRVVAALGHASAAVAPVSAAWLSSVPAGRDLAVTPVPGTGQAGPAVGRVATVVGQVLVSEGPEEFFVVTANGIRAVTETQARLVLGAPDVGSAYPGQVPRAVRVAAADVAALARPADAETAEYPAKRPVLVPIEPGTALCATEFAAGRAVVVVGGAVPAVDAAAVVRPADPSGRVADDVVVPGGTGALVAEEPAPGAKSGTVYLITDTGLKYPVAGDEAVTALGYGPATRHGVPASVLALFPTGVPLDPARARQTIGG